MMDSGIRRLGCILLVSGVAVVSAQDREVAPMPSLAPLVGRVAPAVVNISVTELAQTGRFAFGGRGGPPRSEEAPDEEPEERQGAGSGVIINAELGYVITNHHVIEEARDIEVILADNRSFVADILGSDPESDVAILQIDADGLTAVDFATTSDLMVGDYVVAIGNPFGLGQTVTSGIVSALGRTSGYGGQDEYENFIQTDASINAGNSGGALINMHGELIGINSAIISRTGGSVGIGFAIPSEMVVSVMDRLLEYGTVPRGLLGVYMDSVTPAFAADYGLAVTAGALVLDVIPESAAAAAGLRINDVITGIDGETIANSNELRNLVAMKLPGEPIEVSLVRDGRARTLEAVLKAKDSAANELPLRLESNARPSVFNGIDLMAESDNAEGLRIVDIDASALPIVRERLRRGDLIKAVNQRQVDSVEDAIRLSENFRNIVVEIERFDRTSEERQNFLLRLR